MANEMKSAQQTVLAVVVISVALIIGIFILSQIETSFDTDNTVQSVNGTTGVLNQSGTQLSQSLTAGKTRNAGSYVVLSAINTTSGVTIVPLNYSVNSGTGQVVNTTAFVFQAVTFNWTYQYSANTNASIAAGDSLTALSNGTPWLTILIVVAFAVIVLGYLTSGLGNSNRRDVVY